ncbi:MAG: hypothetical protein AAF542_25810 [Pseudomonadota bacterium]
MTDFTIRNITLAIWLVCSNHWQLIVTSLSLPFIAMFLFAFAISGTYENVLVIPLADLALLFFQAFIALITHRVTLIPETVPKFGLRNFGSRELFFFAYFIGIFGSISILQFLLSRAGAALLTLPIAIWLLSRFSLCLPGIAIGDFVSIKGSWKLTRPHQGIMLMVVLIFPLVIALCTTPFIILVPASIFLLEPVATVITVMAISIAYAHIRPVGKNEVSNS